MTIVDADCSTVHLRQDLLVVKIAFYSDNFYPELSGISDALLSLTRELARRGHNILCCVPRYSGGDYSLYDGIDHAGRVSPPVAVRRLPSVPIPTGTKQGRLVLPVGWSLHAMKQFMPDVIHANGILGTGVEALLASWVHSVPLVATNHTPVSEFLFYVPIQFPALGRFVDMYNCWFHNRCRFVSSPSAQVFAAMRHFRTDVPHAVMSNPVETETFVPVANKAGLKSKYNLGEFALLYAGRLAEEKHVDTILQALPAIRHAGGNVTLTIIGVGSATDKLRDITAKLGLGDVVQFLGFIASKTELAEIYGASDLFVMMSTAESQCLAAMQSLSCGVPVVAARAWGLAEYIVPEVGVLVDPGNTEELGEQIVSLRKNPDLLEQLGRRGREYVEAWRVTRIADAWEQVYAAVT